MKEKLVNELIQDLFKEKSEYQNINIPEDFENKRKLLRGLINLREPKEIDESILEKEDKLLQLELEEKGIVDVDTMDVIERNMVLYQGDITTIKADAIVNAGNNYGLGCFVPNHLCIDNAIHTYAGMRLRLECNEKLQGRTIKNGDILVCKGYNLPSKYVITTVGPEIHGEITKIDESDLALCYQNSLEYAVNNNFKSIVFPSISTGLFGYPIDQAKIIAYKTVKEFLKKNENIKVCFNVFSNFDYEQYRELFNH